MLTAVSAQRIAAAESATDSRSWPQAGAALATPLRGRVLPIGGLKEKCLAAHRAGIKTVLFPWGNRKDVKEIPRKVREAVTLIPVKHVDEILKVALVLEKPE